MSTPEGNQIVIASCSFDPQIEDPDALLTQYEALSGWANAVAEAGASPVTVVQRFTRDAIVRRSSVDYHLVSDGPRADASPWSFAPRTTDAVARLRPEVVHVDGMIFPFFVRGLRSKLCGRAAILVQDHGGLHAGSPGFRRLRWRALHRFGLASADGFLFTALDQAAPWRRAGIIDADQAIHEVPESSTHLASRPAPVSSARPLPGRPAVLWVGRLDPNKDPLTVLDGFELAAGALPDAVLTLVFGDDRLLAEVKSRIAGRGWRSRVELRGKVDRSELPSLYSQADLFVLGSHHEGSGFALLEALSFGVTPLVTDIAPFRALTDQGRLGGLYRPGDSQHLAQQLERLGGTDLAARRSLVRGHFERELSWSAIGRKAVAIYRAAAAARLVPSGRGRALE